VWTVWLGCSLVTLGICLAFFMSHRRVWLKVEEKEGSLQVMLAGSSNKNKEAFKNDFDNNFKKIKATGEKR
jgi:cytochrome c biogenesis protein